MSFTNALCDGPRQFCDSVGVAHPTAQQQDTNPIEVVRWMDWRFLLPNPPDRAFQHLVLLGGKAGLAERIVELGLARKVSCKIPKKRCADAVVVLHNAQPSLRDAAACLVAGGVFYSEIDRRSPSTATISPGRIRRSLQGFGLSQTGLYWVRPDLISPQAYVPLGIPGALRWYLRSMFTAPTAAVRLLESGLYILARLGNHPFAALAPCYAVTAVAGPPGDASASLLRHPALPSELRRSDLRPILCTHGRGDFRRVTLIPFAPNSDRPLAVLKLSRLPIYNDWTENEQAVLTRIHANLDETMRGTIPQPLGIIPFGQLSIGVESCAPGRSVANLTSRWAAPLPRKIDELRLASSWLAEFHCRVQIERSRWADSDVDKWVEKPLAAYEQAFGVTSGEERLFAATRKRASSLIGLHLPTVWVHWDFSEENIFRADRGITVIDWESGTPGPPLLDLLFFATHWSYSARSLNTDAARLRAFRQLFCDSHPSDAASAAVRKAIAEYMARLNIDHRFFPLMLVLVWVVRALGRVPWHIGRNKRGANVRAGNRFVGYLGALAEDVERLFTPT